MNDRTAPPRPSRSLASPLEELRSGIGTIFDHSSRDPLRELQEKGSSDVHTKRQVSTNTLYNARKAESVKQRIEQVDPWQPDAAAGSCAVEMMMVEEGQLVRERGN